MEEQPGDRMHHSQPSKHVLEDSHQDDHMSKKAESSPSSSFDEVADSSATNDEYPSMTRLLFITPGIMAAVLMVALDNYIIATAIPKIAEQFHGLSAVGWYASSYFLTQMAFQPAFGTLYSTLSVKWLFIIAMAIFEVGSVVCATARSSATFVVGRLVAGVGGAGLYVGTLTMAVQVVSLARRPFYLSLVTGMFGLASIAGPVLGGIFTDSSTLTWRFCFWINLPIGFVAAVLIGLVYKDRATGADRPSLLSQLSRLDLPGLVFLLAAFACFISALENGGIRYPWSDSRVWGCLLGFFLLLTAFVLIQTFCQTRVSVPLEIISQRTVAGCCAFILFVSMSVGSLIYYLPFYFQAVRNRDASASGIDNLPFLVVMLFSPLISGSVASASGHYIPFMWIGPIISAVGSGLLSTLDGASSLTKVDTYQVLAGLGIGFCTQLPFTAVQAVLPADTIVMANSLVSLCNSLGPILGTNIAQSIFTNILIKKLGRMQDVDDKNVLTQGIVDKSSVESPLVRGIFAIALQRAYLVPTVCCGLAFFSSFLIRHVRLRQAKRE